MGYSAVGCIVTLTLSLLGVPLAAAAQPSAKVARIGYLLGTTQEQEPLLEAFLEAMRALGYVEGEHFVMEYRAAEGQYERLPALAAELVRLQVDVLLVVTTPAALAAKQATTTIPIVMLGVGDPVKNGLVASLARPGGNITGLASLQHELTGKRLELLKAVLPTVRLPRGRPLESRQSRPHCWGAGGGRGGPGVGRPAAPRGGARSRRV
jgi:putative tryptophan/tyrosine transport system substrate-binding protein